MRRRKEVAEDMPDHLREFRASDWNVVELTPAASAEELWARTKAVGQYASEKRAWLKVHGLGVVDSFVEAALLNRETREAIYRQAHPEEFEVAPR